MSGKGWGLSFTTPLMIRMAKEPDYYVIFLTRVSIWEISKRKDFSLHGECYLGTDKEFQFGLTEGLAMKATGKTIKDTEKVDTFFQMAVGT